jgi:hypothetical protein
VKEDVVGICILTQGNTESISNAESIGGVIAENSVSAKNQLSKRMLFNTAEKNTLS